ncbi:MAG: hypothetical protein BGO29_15800 [Bacteroidales bacterium 36-12]|nr:MAG: hypothetical protein BGO29_15800 [Bacteroidales bacterium 36-12]
MSIPLTVRERIISFLTYKDISRYRFYKDTGLSNGFLDKAGSINSDNCEKICYCYPELNPEWLLIGKGEMLKSDEINEQSVDEQKASIEILVKKIVELSSENTLLKKENAELRSSTVYSTLSKQEEDNMRNIAAEPREE